MKIIDLLNKIANGEEVPKKIKFCFRTFEYNGMGDYLCIDKNDYSKEDYCNGYSIHKWIFGNNINEEVEILEEEKKIPEKLEKYKEIDDEEHYANILKVSTNGECEIDEETSVIVDKVNEIIDYLDYLKSKGEE